MKVLRILCYLCCLLFVFTGMAVTCFPALASSPLPYWSSMTNLVLVPIGLVLSAYVLLSRPESRRKAGWLTLGFTGLYAVMLAVLLTTSFITYRLITLPDVDALVFPLGKLYGEDSSKNPRTAASRVYTVSGVEVPYPTADNSCEMYRASEPEKTKWEEYKRDQAETDYQLAILDESLRRDFLLMVVSLCVFLLSIAVGTAGLMLGRSQSMLTKTQRASL